MKKIILFAVLACAQLSAQHFTDQSIPCEEIAKVFKCRVPPEHRAPGGEIYEFVQSYEMCLVNARVLSEVLGKRYEFTDSICYPKVIYEWKPVNHIQTYISSFDESQGCYVVWDVKKNE